MHGRRPLRRSICLCGDGAGGVIVVADEEDWPQAEPLRLRDSGRARWLDRVGDDEDCARLAIRGRGDCRPALFLRTVECRAQLGRKLEHPLGKQPGEPWPRREPWPPRWRRPWRVPWLPALP